MVAVGDICLGLDVKRLLSEAGPEWIFGNTGRVLADADVVFGNLECIISDDDVAHQPGTVAVPPSRASCIRKGLFTVLNVANNHIMDLSDRGLLDTLRFLDSQGVGHIGAGIDDRSATDPVIIDCRGLRIGFLGYADNSTGNKQRLDPAARYCKPGIACLKERKLYIDIQKLRSQVDILVVSIHADLEFQEYPSMPRVELSRRLIDYGADVLLEHHPHVVQGVERYKRGIIAYSLGNFIFPVKGNEYMEGNSSMCDKGFLLKIDLGRSGVIKHDIVPFEISNQHSPELMDEVSAGSFKTYVQRLSENLANEYFIENAWYQTSRRQLMRELWGLVGMFHRHGVGSVLRRIFYLFRTSENRRWMKGVVAQFFHRKYHPRERSRER